MSFRSLEEFIQAADGIGEVLLVNGATLFSHDITTNKNTIDTFVSYC